MKNNSKPKTVAVMADHIWAVQFGPAQRERLAALADRTSPVWVPSLESPEIQDQLGTVEVVITSWGAPPFDAGLLNRMPRLRAILHAAGSVRGLVSDALWDRPIVVSNSADLNAEPVAEYTLAAILMAGKKAPFLAADAREYRADWSSCQSARGALGNSGLTIGLVGFSRIGRKVAELIDTVMHQATCLVADPYADADEVARFGARLVPLEELLSRVDILSLHAPALPATRHMIAAAQLAALPDQAVVINTARGALIDTASLEAECVSGRLHAILDVTDPEPLPADSPLYDLPNVMITPHIAGAQGAETRRMADGALDELDRLSRGLPLRRRVDRDGLAISA
ncbi:hydroxyacid dehydrogenase [Nonomuraea angiospora]